MKKLLYYFVISTVFVACRIKKQVLITSYSDLIGQYTDSLIIENVLYQYNLKLNPDSTFYFEECISDSSFSYKGTWNLNSSTIILYPFENNYSEHITDVKYRDSFLPIIRYFKVINKNCLEYVPYFDVGKMKREK